MTGLPAAIPVLEPAAAHALVFVVAVGTLVLMMLSALLERSGHIRLRHWAENAGDRVRTLYTSRRAFDAFRWLVAVMARIAPVAMLCVLWLHPALAPSSPAAWWLAPALVAAGLLLIEWLNRWLVLRAERALELLTPVVRLLDLALRPLVLLTAPLIAVVGQQTDEEEDEASEDEIDAYIDVGRREGILEPEEEELVRSIVDFGDTMVRSIMTPRVEIEAAPVDIDPRELSARFFESKNTRLPLYQTSIDEIVGVLHIRDLFEALARSDGGPVVVAELGQQPYFVPESKPLPALLAELQARHQQMAIVLDEYGGVAGLVTVEDLVEEIVGDIRDEHEPVVAPEVLGAGRFRVPGRLHLEEVEDLLDLDFDADEQPYETLSGLLCGELGHVPEPGRTIELLGLVAEVEEADERRVLVANVRRAPTEEQVSAAAPVAAEAREEARA
ncbi:MAG: hemolysin family protein [Acidobacteriota bacterium]